jgi:uncharacterized protein (DUF111 family)
MRKAHVQHAAPVTYEIGMIDHMVNVVGLAYGLDYLSHSNAADLWAAAMQRAA